MKNSSYKFFIDPAANCFCMKFYGVLDLDIVNDGSRALGQHHDYQCDFNRLVDVTNCEIALTSEDLRLISERFLMRETEKKTYKVLFLVDSLLAHGLARIFGSMVSRPTEFFQILNIEEANSRVDIRNWLELNDEYIFPEFLTNSNTIFVSY